MAEPLSPSDLSAIQAERGPVHMHVGGVLVLDGQIGREAVVERIEQRIHLIPRYRMRLEEVLGGAGYPVWEEDRQFDPGRHVRRMAVPAPGGDAELARARPQAPKTCLNAEIGRDRLFAIARARLDQGVYFGLLADRDAVPDVADAARGIERALDELISAVQTA